MLYILNFPRELGYFILVLAPRLQSVETDRLVNYRQTDPGQESLALQAFGQASKLKLLPTRFSFT